MNNLTLDPILAHHFRAVKMVQDSLARPISDCCGCVILDLDDHEVCARCGQLCSVEQ